MLNPMLRGAVSCKNMQGTDCQLCRTIPTVEKEHALRGSTPTIAAENLNISDPEVCGLAVGGNLERDPGGQ